MCAGANPIPFDAILGGLYLEPIIVLQFIGLDVSDDGLEFLPEPIFPLLILGAGVD